MTRDRQQRRPRQMSGGRDDRYPLGYFNEREAAQQKADFDDIMSIHPHNIDAEAALIGSLMIENRMIERVLERGLTVEHFWEPTHARVFDRIQMLAAKGVGANPVTLRPFFAGETFTVSAGDYGAPDIVKSIGGYLAELTGNPVSLLGVMGFVDQVMELSALRDLMAALRDVAADAADTANDMDPRRILQVAETRLAEIGSNLPEAVVTGMDWEDSFDETVADATQINEGDRAAGIEIDGYTDWNEVAGAMEPGDMLLLAGRPGMGKTGVSCAIAAGAAMAGWATDFLSLEMPRKQISRRILANVIFVEGETSRYDEIKKGAFTRADLAAIERTRSLIKGKPLHIDEAHEFFVEDFGAWLKRRKRAWKAKGFDYKLCVVDYLDKFSTRKEFGPNETQRISYISRLVKAALKAAGVAGVILCQLSRRVDEREDKRPHMSDLRQSGSLEQDADGVFFVYRDEYYLQRSRPAESNEKKMAEWADQLAAARDRLELIAAKRREGGLSRRTGYFFEDYQAVRPSTFRLEEVDLFNDYGGEA